MLPAKEGSSPRVKQDSAGQWLCDTCDFKSDRYQSVIGHLGVHADNPKKRGRPKGASQRKDPLDLTLTQLVSRLEQAEAEVLTLKSQLRKEKQRNDNVRAAMSAFLSPKE